MEQFLTLNDLPSLSEAVNEAIELKKSICFLITWKSKI